MRDRVWLVTGGAGFIGSAFIRLVLAERPDISVINLDALTYAANQMEVDVDWKDRYRFVRGDICDSITVDRAVSGGVDAIVNFAAETHVDRSISDPERFLRTNVLGTNVLLESARKFAVPHFLQVSTDEVYGHVAFGTSLETDPLAPRSPYAASKAAGDLQALAYAATYGTPVLVTRGSNTYGAYQYPEKLIPLFTTNLLDGQPVPIYGDGMQIRDWLHVADHARGILHVLEFGTPGEIYNLGGNNLRTNRDVAERLIEACGGNWETHVRHVLDRPGHDRRYALATEKARALGWIPKTPFEEGLAATVRWYREHEAWWRPIKSGDFAEYYRRQYADREMR